MGGAAAVSPRRGGVRGAAAVSPQWGGVQGAAAVSPQLAGRQAGRRQEPAAQLWRQRHGHCSWVLCELALWPPAPRGRRGHRLRGLMLACVRDLAEGSLPPHGAGPRAPGAPCRVPPSGWWRPSTWRDTPDSWLPSPDTVLQLAWHFLEKTRSVYWPRHPPSLSLCPLRPQRPLLSHGPSQRGPVRPCRRPPPCGWSGADSFCRPGRLRPRAGGHRDATVRVGAVGGRAGMGAAQPGDPPVSTRHPGQ